MGKYSGTGGGSNSDPQGQLDLRSKVLQRDPVKEVSEGSKPMVAILREQQAARQNDLISMMNESPSAVTDEESQRVFEANEEYGTDPTTEVEERIRSLDDVTDPGAPLVEGDFDTDGNFNPLDRYEGQSIVDQRAAAGPTGRDSFNQAGQGYLFGRDISRAAAREEIKVDNSPLNKSTSLKLVDRLNQGLKFVKDAGSWGGISTPGWTTSVDFVRQYPEWVQINSKGEASIQLLDQERRIAYTKYRANLPGSLLAGLTVADAISITDSGLVIDSMAVPPAYEMDSDGSLLLDDKKKPTPIEKQGPMALRKTYNIDPNLIRILLGYAEESISSSQYSDINADKEFLSEPEKVQFKDAKFLAKNRSSGAIGSQVIKQYLFNKGMKETDIDFSNEEAVTLGDFAQELFYSIHGIQNKIPLVGRHAGKKDSSGNKSPVQFYLTPEGHRVFNDPRSRLMRKLLMGGTFVDINTSSVKEKQNKLLGNKKGYKSSKIAQEARTNFANIDFIVNNKNINMLFQILIPFLRQKEDGKNYISVFNKIDESSRWKLDAVGLGQSKINDIEYSIKVQQRIQTKNRKQGLPVLRVPTLTEEYDATVFEIAQDLKGLVMASDVKFSFNTAIQTFSGRLDILTTLVNPQASKIQRGAMSNPKIYPIHRGSKALRILRQMYALNFSLKSAPYFAIEDSKVIRTQIKTSQLQFEERDRNLAVHSNMFEEWGDRIIEVFKLDTSSSDLKAQKLAFHPRSLKVGEGHFTKLVRDQVFNKINSPMLDPKNELDAKLIEAIKEKGIEAVAFMKDLADYSKFKKWERSDSKTPFFSSVTTHLDGKTNGPGIIAMLLGNTDTLFKVGVLRSQGITTLDNGDLRDEIIHVLLGKLAGDPTWEWNYKGYNFNNVNNNHSNDDSGIPYTDIKNIYSEVAKYRELAKHVIMTVAYGKESDSYKADVTAAIDNIYSELKSKGEPNEFIDSYERLESSNNLWQVSDVIHVKYMEGFESLLQDNVLEMKSLLRSVVLSYQLMDLSELSFKSADGSTLSVNLNESVGYENSTNNNYAMARQIGTTPELSEFKFKKIELAQYENKNTLTARDATDIDYKSGVNKSFAGASLHSSIIAKIVHSVDAAVMNIFLTSKSWQELRLNSNGNPFLLAVYDAIYTDIGTFDTAFRNINKVFGEVIYNYNVFQEVLKSLESEYRTYMKEINRKDPKEHLTDDDKRFFLDMFSFNSGRKDDSTIYDPKLGSLAKFSETSRFEKNKNSHKSKNTSWLGKKRADWSTNESQQDADLQYILDFIYGSKYEFDVSKQVNYQKTEQLLDYSFLKELIPLYFNYLYGKNFSRFRTFATETHIAKNKAYKMIKDIRHFAD